MTGLFSSSAFLTENPFTFSLAGLLLAALSFCGFPSTFLGNRGCTWILALESNCFRGDNGWAWILALESNCFRGDNGWAWILALESNCFRGDNGWAWILAVLSSCFRGDRGNTGFLGDKGKTWTGFGLSARIIMVVLRVINYTNAQLFWPDIFCCFFLSNFKSLTSCLCSLY